MVIMVAASSHHCYGLSMGYVNANTFFLAIHAMLLVELKKKTKKKYLRTVDDIIVVWMLNATNSMVHLHSLIYTYI